jgi:hypothetical protein
LPKVRNLFTNFSKGELSPLLEGASDLAVYFEGGSVIENFRLVRQGGIQRRAGTRFIAEVKDSSSDTIVLPFEFSVDDSYILEVGDGYFRVFKDKAQVLGGGFAPIEVALPYATADIRAIHTTQSADVLFCFHGAHQQRKIGRVSDTSWSVTRQTANPPPSFEVDTDISGGVARLTPGATTGTGIVFTTDAASFLAGDAGRQIISGAGRAIITTYTSDTQVTVDILDDFASVAAIDSGDWLMRLSPQTTLDPTIRSPVGASVTCVAGANAFRTQDVGKYVLIYGGLIKITSWTSATTVVGTLLSTMSETTDANPAAAPAGAWTLEEGSWSDIQGWPRTGEFYQGRLYQASTTSLPTAFWASAADDYDNYAYGTVASASVEYVMAARKLNRIEWLSDNDSLIVGTSGSEHRATGSGNDNALIGGDTVPLVRRVSSQGSMPVQPIVSNRQTIFADRSTRKIYSLAWDLSQDGYDSDELTLLAEHITESGVRLGPMAFQQRLDPRLFFVREDGALVSMTLFIKEKVIGFTRYVTDGAFESVGVIPNASGGNDQVWVIAKRTINGATKRFVEMLEEDHEDLTERSWSSLQTDCARVYSGVSTTSIPVSHLEGKTVDVIVGNEYIGTKVVSGGVVTLTEAATEVEVGLRYASTATTMRPAIKGENIEGVPRSWDKLSARVHKTKGGAINGKAITYAPTTLGVNDLYTGDVKVTAQGWSTDGRVTILQDQPYPMTVLALYGVLSLGEKD